MSWLFSLSSKIPNLFYLFRVIRDAERISQHCLAVIFTERMCVSV